MNVNHDRINNCIYIKSILMILVVVGHSCIFWTETWFTKDPVYSSQWLSIISQWLKSFHTYAFTLVSGYIFCYKIQRGYYQNYKPFLANKVKRLLVPYVFSAVVWIIPISNFFFHYSADELVTKYVLCDNPAQLWFLWMLFWVFAIVWPIKKTIIEHNTVGVLLGLVFYCASIFGEKMIPNIFCIWRACRYLIYFIIGIIIRAKEEKKEKSILSSIPAYGWLLLHIVLFVASLYISQYRGMVYTVLSIVLNMLCNIVGAYMAFMVLNMLSRKTNWRDNQLFKTLSRLSMPIYLFHQQIIYFVISGLNGKINPWLNATLNFVSAILGAGIISLLLMKYGLTRKLIGEK